MSTAGELWMGIMDSAKGFLTKAKSAAKQHPDQLSKGIDRAEQAADKATGGKYDDQIAKAGEQAEGFLTGEQGHGDLPGGPTRQ
jgi:MT0933-like antitoxin protein